MANSKYITQIIREASKRAPIFGLGEIVDGVTGYKGRQVTRKSTLNRFVQDVVDDLASEGKIPAKFARRAKQAISWQNDTDNAEILSRRKDGIAIDLRHRKSKGRPALGYMKYYLAPKMKGFGEPTDQMELAFRTRNRRNMFSHSKPDERFWNTFTVVSNPKSKVTKPSAERMIRETKQKLQQAGYDNKLRERKFGVVVQNGKRVAQRIPQNKRDKIIQSLASIYNDERRRIPMRAHIADNVRARKPWKDIANVTDGEML